MSEALALYGGDPIRQRLMAHLGGVAETVGADRVAALWVDEYGPGLVHTHCVLDLVAQPPNDSFRIAPLQLSWNEGVPGLVDMPDSVGRRLPFLEGVESACYIALGSDGMRAWFLTADSRTARDPIAGKALDDLMFAAGEIAAVVLHMDLAEGRPLQVAVGSHTAMSGLSNAPGWPVLKDLEGRESEKGIDRRIGTRFAVARLLHTMIDEDFVLPPSTLDEKITELRKSFDVVPADDSERAEWVRVADALEAEDRLELARAVLDMGRSVESQGHQHGASELFHAAYHVSTAGWGVVEAIDSARLHGLSARRLADWDAAFYWHEVARALAEAADHRGRLALVLNGVANIHREKGNLPLARICHDDALRIAKEAGDQDTIGTVHHDVMVLEKLSGRPEVAVRHGWEAVQSFPSKQKRLRALTDLAWAFVELGELTAAEDAYELVAAGTNEFLYKVYALDALAYIEALRGNRPEFERRLWAVDDTAWRSGPSFLVAELTLYRGKAFCSLGDSAEGRSWLREAMEIAEKNGHSQLYFDAEQELERRDARKQSTPLERPQEMARETLADIRDGLSQMRVAVGA